MSDYRVQLDAFEGPLDLLLFLIRRHELEIADIPIAELTEQYLGHIEGLDEAAIDVELAAEFLVMAATLVEIKSRMIAAEQERRDAEREGRAPGDPTSATRTTDGPAEDPREGLVRQLLEYKTYRDAADRLEQRREAWERRTPLRPVAVTGEELKQAFESIADEAEIEELNVFDLSAAFERIAASVNLDRLGEHEVVSDETPIELHAEDIVDRLKREHSAGGQLPLFGIFQGRTRAEMVGLFLALLDLVRRERVGFRQGQDAAGTADQIVVELRTDVAEDPESDTSEQTEPAAAT